jgi:cyclin-dependent kinase-like
LSAYSLESQSYPADEAASLESLTFRQKQAGNLFLGYFENSVLCAYVCGTRYQGPRYQKASLHQHEPDADCVCIHSVVVERSRRRKGLGSRIVQEYVKHINYTERDIYKLILLTKANNLSFYSKCGFVCIGKSNVEHGQDTWYEMELKLPHAAT